MSYGKRSNRCSRELYLDSDMLFHCSEKCALLKQKEYKVHNMCMYEAFEYIYHGLVCDNCYNGKSIGKSLKYLRELWLEILKLLRP